ncbi:hypothetical protein PT2222_240051 [Paraburkholderia tropica]
MTMNLTWRMTGADNPGQQVPTVVVITGKKLVPADRLSTDLRSGCLAAQTSLRARRAYASRIGAGRLPAPL